MRTNIHRMMVTLMLVFVASSTASARFGLGVMLGEPTGLSIKQWKTNQHAVDGALAWSFEHDGLFHIHADYLYHDYHLLAELIPGRHAPAYIGVGTRFAINERVEANHPGHVDVRLGMRFPVGASYLFTNYPLEFFIELAPTLDVLPETSFEMNAALGMRFYFN
jgi:hypothetical protein